MICPFFCKNEGCCDIGSGYVSAHDVKIIVTFCLHRYRECSAHQELASRLSPLATHGGQAPGRRELPNAAMASRDPGGPANGTFGDHSCFQKVGVVPPVS